MTDKSSGIAALTQSFKTQPIASFNRKKQKCSAINDNHTPFRTILHSEPSVRHFALPPST
jgi:hypothetical protein